MPSLYSKIIASLTVSVAGGGAILGSVLSSKNIKSNDQIELDLDGLTHKKDDDEQNNIEQKDFLKIEDPLKNKKELDNSILKEKDDFVVKEAEPEFISDEQKEQEINLDSRVENEEKKFSSLIEEREKRYELERKEKKITLEIFWLSEQGGYCFLSKENQITKMPKILDDSDEVEFKNNCYDNEQFHYETSWSEEKSLEDNEEILWIRGGTNEVKGLFDANWDKDDLFKQSRFIREDKKNSSVSTSFIKDLVDDSVCKVIEKDNGNWTEVSCSRKKFK